jgi:hypothetical protein
MNLRIGLTRDHPALNNSRQFPGVGVLRRSLVESVGMRINIAQTAWHKFRQSCVRSMDQVMLTSIECRSQNNAGRTTIRRPYEGLTRASRTITSLRSTKPSSGKLPARAAMDSQAYRQCRRRVSKGQNHENSHAVGLSENVDHAALDVAITVHVRGLQARPACLLPNGDRQKSALSVRIMFALRPQSPQQWAPLPVELGSPW